jgi:integrase
VSVERLKPPVQGQIDVFDRGYPGLALRISYGGGKTFVFFYRIGGKLKRMTLGTYPAMSLAKARETWRQARQDASEGRDPSSALQRQRPSNAFQSVAEEWLRRDQQKNRTHGAVERILNKDVLPFWGHRNIKDISRRDVLDLIDGINDRGAVYMARQVHAHLHRLFRWCVGRGILEANPLADLPKPGAAVARDRVFTDAELASLWKAAETVGWPYGPIVQLLILTGARREEIGALRCSEVQDAKLHLAGERTKIATAHAIPLSAPAKAIIEQLPRIGDSDFVFTANGRTPVSGWSKAKRKLELALGQLSDWRLHDIRRTTATGLQKLGVSLQVIEAVLGHVSGSRAGVVGIYQRHSFDAEKAAALEAWGAHVMALLESKQPAKSRSMRGRNT